MRGLDTRGLADGFAQGFGLMERHQQRKIDNERADRQEARQGRFDEMQEAQFQQHQEDRAKGQGLEQIKQYWAQVESGMDPEITPGMQQAFEAHPMLSPQRVLDPNTEAAVQTAERVALGDLDPNSPQGLAAFNQLFPQEVSAGDAADLKEGQRAVKRISAVYPGSREGTVVFELDVDVLDADGRKVRSYKAPMTPSHSAGDDEILQVPIETLVNRAVAMQNVQRAIPPEMRERQLNYLRNIGVLPQTERWEQVDGPGGAILQRNTRTGQMQQVVGREPRYGLSGAGGYAPSSDVKTLQWLMSEEGGGLTDREARDELVRLKRGGGDGAISAGDRYRVTYITNQIKEIDKQLEGFPEPDEEARLRQARAQLVSQREAMASQLGLTGAPPAQSPEAVGATGSGTDQELRSLGLW